MKYYRSGNIVKFLKRKSTESQDFSLHLATVLSLFVRVARGLQVLHKNNIGNIDLKPDTLLIDEVEPGKY